MIGSNVTADLAAEMGLSGEEFARATLRFDLRADWARWVKSFRIHLLD